MSKILVVDDELFVCDLLSRFLEERGHVALKASDGNEALEMYKTERPDVVLLDIRMPNKYGLETLRELKEFDPKTSVIMITAVTEEDIALKALDEGAFDYIVKPVNSDYLEMSLMTKLALIDEGD